MKKRTLLFAWLLSACGAATTVSGTDTGTDALRMRHQILFESAGDTQVFDGYMILDNETFLVKAFAGPGVSLFSVAREGEAHKEILHIDGLADRLDAAKIGADIFRVYMAGCNVAVPSEGSVHCQSHGQQVTERYDTQGRPVVRVFPDAHGIGLTIRYEQYDARFGPELPLRIELRWGADRTRKMVIRTVSAEPASAEDVRGVSEFLQP